MRQNMTSRKKTLLTLGLVGLPLALGGAYWAAGTTWGAADTGETPFAEPLPVVTFTARPVESYERLRPYTGVLRELRRSQLGFQRAGEIIELSVEEGDAVTTGQVLARLDDRHLRARQSQVEAQIAEAEAVLAELTAGPRLETIAAKKAELASQSARRDLLKLQLDRREQLMANSSVSREEYESTLFDFRASVAMCQQIEQQLDEYLAGTRPEQLRAQRARIEQLTATLAEISHDLEDTLLKAPFSGRISQRMVDEGTVMSPGSAVFELLDDTELEAWVGVPPSATSGMKLGEPRMLEVDGQPITATLRALAPHVDQATRTRKVILRITPVDSANLLPGQTVRMSLAEQVDEPGYWIPSSALARGRRGLWSVYVVDENSQADHSGQVIAQREVELLDTVGGESFVRGTLRPRDEVVAAGTHRVVVGQRVLSQPTRISRLSP